jgi:membrane dipeptidase
MNEPTPVVVDAHGHTLDLAFHVARPLNAPLGGTTDVPLMRVGGVTAQLNASWTPSAALSGPHGHSVADAPAALGAMLDYLDESLAGPAGRDVVVARWAADLTEAADSGRVALILGMEGTDAIGGDPAALAPLHRRGIRHICLIHEHANEFGASSQVWEGGAVRRYRPGVDPAGHLSGRGRELLAEARRLGWLIDLTHLVEPAFWEVLEAVEGPVIVSHGGVRALCDSPRYLTDSQIRAVAASGGVMGASPSPLGPSDEAPGLGLLLDTIDHLVAVAGADHVAIGTDFKDQLGYYPHPLPHIGEWRVIAPALAERGHSPGAIEGILGANFVRVFEQVVG